MSWWSTSWLPTLPSIDFSLPSSIQKRFISFALRQALGHLLKPGQLDTQQVDSQIGSGFVQIRDVELDNKAINTLIAGLPIELHDGSVGKVTARIPWPNPLTSVVGLSLESLHLTFIVSPKLSTGASYPSAADLTESVTSVAESFVHDELNPEEEEALRGSFHSELGSSRDSIDHVPGSLDPFLPEDESHPDSEPSGVSIFATLVERLLARFEFDSTDLKITLVHPEHASFTIHVPSVRYRTEVKQANPSDTQISSRTAGEGHASRTGSTRTVTISGVNITTRSLRPPSPQPILSRTSPTASIVTHSSQTTLHAARESSQPSSPLSDSSELDEETTLFMSQSLAGLPPRPPSPSDSVASSMYQSAISTAPMGRSSVHAPGSFPRSPSPSHIESPSDIRPANSDDLPSRLQIRTQEIEDETLLSFGNEPITLSLWTPSTLSDISTQSPGPSQAHSASVSRGQTRQSGSRSVDKLNLDVEVGVVAIALRARHIRHLLDIAELWLSHTHSPPVRANDQSSETSRPPSQKLDASLRIRGLVVTLLPGEDKPSATKVAISDYFKHPLVPPRLPHGYVRIHLEEFSASLCLQPTAPAPLSRPSTAAHTGSTITARVALSELSAFAFVRSPGYASGSELAAIPLLITDPNLPFQYGPSHVHPDLKQSDPEADLPTFEIVDWTNPNHWTSAAKLSAWRTKQFQGRGPTLSESPRNLPRVSRSPSSPSYARGSTPASSPISKAAAGYPGAQSAVVVKLTITSAPPSRRGRGKGKDPESGVVVDIDIAPLHVFVDVAQVLGRVDAPERSEVLNFVDEVLSSSETILYAADDGEGTDDEDEDEDDGETPPGTPRARQRYAQRQQEREKEEERRRLERLVLEDLDLGFDYSQTTSGPSKGAKDTGPSSGRRKKAGSKRKASAVTVTCKVPTIRLEIRGASKGSREARSGAVVVDIHDLCISSGDTSDFAAHGTRFADVDSLPEYQHPERAGDASTLATARWSRLVFSHCSAGETKAIALLSIGAFSPLQPQTSNTFSGSPSASPLSSKPAPRPSIAVSQGSSRPSMGASELTTLVLTVDIPSVFVRVSKAAVDGLQLWADDISRLTESAFSSHPSSASSSRDPSLIGSRFFAKTRRSDGSASDSISTVSAQRTEGSKETIIKVSLGEVAVMVDLPRHTPQSSAIRPFNVIASDVDVLVEVKPEGKEETVITLGVMDLNVLETALDGNQLAFLNLTTPREAMATNQSLLKLRFTSFVVANTTAKESRVKLTVCGITYTVHPDLQWLSDLAEFAKAPPGVFESVVPSERTVVSVKVLDTSVKALAPKFPGAMVLHVGEADFSTTVVGNSPQSSFRLSVQPLSLFLVDDVNSLTDTNNGRVMSRLSRTGGGVWKAAGYALLTELTTFELQFAKRADVNPPDLKITIDHGDLRLHLAADTGTALGAFIGDFSSLFSTPPDPNIEVPKRKREPTEIASPASSSRNLMASLDEHAFRRRIPQVGATPDMIDDDLPTNLDYLDDSFSTSAGLRALDDDEEDEFYPEDGARAGDQTGVIETYGGETIRLLDPEGLRIIEHHFDTLPPDSADESSQYGDTTLKVRVHNSDITVFLYDGYDWERTRKIIQEETREMRRRLARIRQLIASGQTPDPSVEETNTLLFNSVYIGLEHNVDELDNGALIEAIDKELEDDAETVSVSSWQSFKPSRMSPGNPEGRAERSRKILTRSKGPSIEFRLQGLEAEFDNYRSHSSMASRTLVTVQDVEILDHIKTSTWSKFLTSLRTDSRGNIRETGSNMVRVELQKVYPVEGNSTEEARLKAKILPLRLHVDQDALDFMKKFFSFKDPESTPAPSTEPSEEIFFQHVEVFPVDLKLDYKPRRVDYRALRDGRTIELMNFFHFDGAEMTLRHITLTGITGWARVGDLLNDLWTPDVKATQLVEVISGVAPIRSVVNVGSGVADLVLLPISQYKKDGRVVRGLQKGTTAFVKSTATEAVKLGARLATGTQVILEQAEHVIGGQFTDSVTAEALQLPAGYRDEEGLDEDLNLEDLISRYADQPAGVKEGVVSAYKSLRRNLTSAAQTILAVPMEVYERSGNEGAVRAVVRAVPIAVLRPMIGASEAVSKTLLGLHNTLDPNVRAENEAKYKQR